jgi:hypothetical protein
VQGTPLQQSALVVHTCPYAAQPPPDELPLLEDEPLLEPLPLPEEVPPDEVPPDAPPELPPDDELPVPHGPHVPFVLPGAMLHVVPGQQSLVVVHAPPHETHVPP